MGSKRALTSPAGTTAAAVEPPPARTDATANGAEPEKTTTDMTAVASTPLPRPRATPPN